MYLITSAAFLAEDLKSEFGKIPSSFLPINNKRLFEEQRKLIPKSEKVFLSLPETYVLSDIDKIFLKNNKIEFVKVPERKTLAESIVYTLNIISLYNENLFILHGDTLFKEIPHKPDCFSISIPQDNYEWDNSQTKNYVYSGFFSFSNQKLLIKSLLNFDFINAIKDYKSSMEVELKINENWYDCGHINTYYHSKKKYTTERNFNSLKINDYSVVKSGLNNKILAEINWFKSIPKDLKKYTPQLLNYGVNEQKNSFYELEYYPFPNLSELYIFGNNKPFVWKKIFSEVFKFISKTCEIKSSLNKSNVSNLNDIYIKKTINRLKIYSENAKIDLNKKWKINGIESPSISTITKDLFKKIKGSEKSRFQIIHGDLCFSNILFSFRNHTIKLIDPRGIDNDNNSTIFGDLRYDLAKLTHSVIGLYDFIIAERFLYKEKSKYDIFFNVYENPNTREIQEIFLDMKLFDQKISSYCIMEIQILLFFSMIPLHSDNPMKQKAFLANAISLYLKYK